jgi:hypothetical protein
MTLILCDPATPPQLSNPLSRTELTRHLDQPEVRSFRGPLEPRSGGSYRTGFGAATAAAQCRIATGHLRLSYNPGIP